MKIYSTLDGMLFHHTDIQALEQLIVDSPPTVRKLENLEEILRKDAQDQPGEPVPVK